MASPKTLVLIETPQKTELLLVNRPPDEDDKALNRDPFKEALERGGTEIGFTARPVAFTAAIAAAVLFGVSRFV